MELVYRMESLSLQTDSPITLGLQFFWHDDDFAVGLTSEDLNFFLQQDLESYDRVLPRYAQYISEVFRYGEYGYDPDVDNLIDSLDFDSYITYNPTLQVATIQIPEKHQKYGWTKGDYQWLFEEFREGLCDGMWQACPMTEAVHETMAVVDYRVLAL